MCDQLTQLRCKNGFHLLLGLGVFVCCKEVLPEIVWKWKIKTLHTHTSSNLYAISNRWPPSRYHLTSRYLSLIKRWGPVTWALQTSWGHMRFWMWFKWLDHKMFFLYCIYISWKHKSTCIHFQISAFNTTWTVQSIKLVRCVFLIRNLHFELDAVDDHAFN